MEDPDEIEGSEQEELSRHPRVRLTRKSLRILRRYEQYGLPPSRVVENALVFGDLSPGLSTITLTDVAGVIATLRVAVKEYNICMLEVFELLTSVELLLENRQLVRPLEADLAQFRKTVAPAKKLT